MLFSSLLMCESLGTKLQLSKISVFISRMCFVCVASWTLDMAVLFGLELETPPENSCMARGYTSFEYFLVLTASVL